MKLSVLPLCFALLCAASAQANDLDCLLTLKGRLVRWDADWQRDRSDMDTPYRVVSVLDTHGDGGMREVVLQLSAIGQASISERTAKIRLDHAAYMLCSRVVEPPRAFTDTNSASLFDPVREEEKIDPAKLSFRTLMQDTWLPAQPPTGQVLTVCRTPYAVFACSAHDRRAWEAVHYGETGLMNLLKTPFPFIRRKASGGWVRAEALSSNPHEPLSECTVLQRTFSCLASEKRLYEGELRALEKVLLTKK
jgi:hypothetical protein